MAAKINMFVYIMYSLDKWYGRERGFSDGRNIKHIMCDTDSGVLWHELVCVCVCVYVCAPIAVYKSCVYVFLGRWYVLSVCVEHVIYYVCMHDSVPYLSMQAKQQISENIYRLFQLT